MHDDLITDYRLITDNVGYISVVLCFFIVYFISTHIWWEFPIVAIRIGCVTRHHKVPGSPPMLDAPLWIYTSGA